MALTKGFARNNAKTPLDQRLADMATIVCNADGTPRTGVLGNANASIASALATWHFRVQAAEFVTSKGKADGVRVAEDARPGRAVRIAHDRRHIGEALIEGRLRGVSGEALSECHES
jgi:hypothetical protein